MSSCNIIASTDKSTVVAEYAAEIEARRKQYEYYRDKLLMFEESETRRFSN
jgi:restriction endonuclease S subunit